MSTGKSCIFFTKLNKMESGNISPSQFNNASNTHDRNNAPGMHQDYATRRILKKADRNIKNNNKWIYISFFIEFVVFIILIVAWATLDKM